MYQRMIREAVPNSDPRYVEAWMRLGLKTFDHLTKDRFEREAKLAAACVAHADERTNADLADSYGL